MKRSVRYSPRGVDNQARANQRAERAAQHERKIERKRALKEQFDFSHYKGMRSF